VALNLYEQAMPQRRQPQDAVERAHQLTLQRLRYEAELARRRDARVAPDTPLVADALDRRGETAWQALQEAEAQFDRRPPLPENIIPFAIPQPLRTAFTSLGAALPPRWPQETLRRAQRKARWRWLLDNVVWQRMTRETLQTRMVWRGGLSVSWQSPVPWEPCVMGTGVRRWRRSSSRSHPKANRLKRGPSSSPPKRCGRPNARACCPVRSTPFASSTGTSTATGAHVRARYRDG
jgi:hypothetical protein